MVVARDKGATVSSAVPYLSQSNPIASSCAIRSAVSFLLDLSGVFSSSSYSETKVIQTHILLLLYLEMTMLSFVCL